MVYRVWIIVPLVIFVLIKIIERLPASISVLNSVGKISLESYLTNISINKLFIVLIPHYICSNVFYGRYLEYSIVIVLGLLLAFMVNKLSSIIINKMR